MTAVEIEKGDPAAFASWLRFWRWVVALLEIVGGLAGIYVVAFGTLTGTSRIIWLLAFVLFVTSVWGGVLLALGRKGGVAVSLVVQALQLVQVATPVFLYTFTCGVQLLVGIGQTESGSDLAFSLNGPAGFFLFVNPPSGGIPSGVMTGVNVASALSIICLLYVRAEQRKAVPPVVSMKEQPHVWPPAPEA